MRLAQGGEAIRTDFQVFRNAHPDLTDLDDPPNPFDTNVYGLASLKNGKHLVTDAGGNELLLVDSKGRVKTVAKFPNASRRDGAPAARIRRAAGPLPPKRCRRASPSGPMGTGMSVS